ncbi:MAG: efflux RND transporter periplasmic adaptor subunit [Planctomycetota bacterium]|jgi:Cu(I)/Ag(I) efflux system membrane fusion protein
MTDENDGELAKRKPEGERSAGASRRTPPPRRSGRRLALIVALLLGVVLGRYACAPAGEPGTHAAEDGAGAEQAAVWTCSMHPQVRRPGPGQCPICQMDLVPVQGGDDEGLDPRSLTMSENAAALAEIITQPVERRSVSHAVRMVGRVTYDESRLSYITAWVPSRLDRLFVDYTGVTVRAGDHMAEVYSPSLIATQQELLGAIATERMLAAGPTSVVQSRQAASVQSARDRLRLWGLDAPQIDEIIERGAPLEHVTINSPVSGIVVHKSAFQGDWVETGARIYTIADLSRVWVQLDAYESDLAWLHYGQEVEFVLEAWPGETFHGRISFVDPVLDDRTRTVKVRLNVDNEALRLKPDMFVRATVEARMTAGGRMIDPELAGRWMCPMHPEVVADDPGACDVCGMDLLPTEELGFRAVQAEELPIVIPASAPLITGTRAIVYVRVPGAARPTYQGREVRLGPRAGDWYIVVDGLAEGEEVVVNGAFKLDSELQIRARPSMMSPEGGAAPPGHQHGAVPPAGEHSEHATVRPAALEDVPAAFREQLGELLRDYLDVQAALAADDVEAAESAGRMLRGSLERVEMGLLDGDAHDTWMRHAATLAAAARRIELGPTLEDRRAAFRDASEPLIAALERFGYALGDEGVAIFHCPMAFDGEGADWLQTGTLTVNPYFGERMLRCGERVRELPAGR